MPAPESIEAAEDPKPLLFVRPTSPEDARYAAELATRLGATAIDASTPTGGGLVLWVEHDRLGVTRGDEDPRHRVTIDFGNSRRGAGWGQDPATELLGRAVGLHRGTQRIVDATAGLGRDAMALARRGAQVVMIERHPLLALLLRDALARLAGTDPALAARVRIVEADARAVLDARDPETLGGDVDVVYLDPMFPARSKAALPKRELQLLRALLGPGGDEVDDLLTAARRVATRRVVVKRPPHAAPLGARPIASHAGSRVRYDVYAPTTSPDQPRAT